MIDAVLKLGAELYRWPVSAAVVGVVILHEEVAAGGFEVRWDPLSGGLRSNPKYEIPYIHTANGAETSFISRWVLLRTGAPASTRSLVLEFSEIELFGLLSQPLNCASRRVC